MAEQEGFTGSLHKLGAPRTTSHYTGSFHALLFLFVSLAVLSIIE